MGKLVTLISLILSNAVAGPIPEEPGTGKYSPKLSTDGESASVMPQSPTKQLRSPVYFQSEMGQIFAKVDPERETIVVTANMLNKSSYGGSFSPTATAFLKPLNNAAVRGFVQVRCIDMLCNSLGVMVGISTKLGNPSAFSEKRFVLFRNTTHSLRNRIAGIGI